MHDNIVPMPDSNVLFPKAAMYDQAWIYDNTMGPNVLWLTEARCSRLNLEADIRVLDLGCGKAISSIFLAKEFDVQVWATDLSVNPSDNWKRIQDAEVQDKVFPVSADAHSLPYSHEFFDIIVSIDAYHYFGTDDLFLKHMARFSRPGGQVGIVCPGFKRELVNDVPDYLYDHYTNQGWHSFHSPAWWRLHWEKCGAVRVDWAEEVPESREIWEDNVENQGPDTQVVLKDRGSLLTFSRVVATKL